MNAAGEGDAKEAAEKAFGEHSDGLEGMPHDERRLRIVLGFLMESLHGRHVASFLGHFQAVGHEDQVILRGDWTEELEGEVGPQSGEGLELQSRRVEEMEQTAVLLGSKEAGADKARDAEEVGADGETGKDETHPHERPSS
jgi:hypothetical protein